VPDTPGDVLRDRFLAPLGLLPADVARATGLHRSTISRILNGTHRITPAVAVRLGAFLGVPARWFVQLQADHDIEQIESGVLPTPRLTPLHIDPDLMITPRGVISLSRLAAAPSQDSGPRTVRYDNGAVALVGSTS
jgi:addiction module HigA family antidote